MDILREGANVIVVEPKSLIDEVKSNLSEALRGYGET
jgi:predicted DNA-binding transcriptional regulator YafY